MKHHVKGGGWYNDERGALGAKRLKERHKEALKELTRLLRNQNSTPEDIERAREQMHGIEAEVLEFSRT